MSSVVPLASILVPAYNAERYIAEAISSILKQTYQNWELIIVDDGSKDETYSIAQSFAKKDSRIQAVEQPNAGASAARNRAFQLSKGEFVKYFDADDILNPEAIEAQIKLALKNPGCIISGRWGRFHNNDLSTFKFSPESVWRDMNGVDWIIESWSKGPNMTQPGIFLLPREVIDKFGGWDESLTLLDDMEFFTRIILKIPKVIFCENAILKYRSGVDGNLSGQKGENAIRSAQKAIIKSTSHLLSINNSQEAKKSAANQIQYLAYEAYPKHLLISKRAEKKVKVLGGATYKLPTGKKTKLISKLLGWKTAKTLLYIKTEFLRKV